MSNGINVKVKSISLLPSLDVIAEANKNHMDFNDYINNLTNIRTPEDKQREQQGDKRRTLNRKGRSTVFLDDIFVELELSYSNGKTKNYNVRIHQLPSDTLTFGKVELILLSTSNDIKTTIAYHDLGDIAFNYGLMQNNSEYQEALGELINPLRLIHKKEIALKSGLNDAIYIGGIEEELDYNGIRTGRFHKARYHGKNDDDVIKMIMDERIQKRMIDKIMKLSGPELVRTYRTFCESLIPIEKIKDVTVVEPQA